MFPMFPNQPLFNPMTAPQMMQASFARLPNNQPFNPLQFFLQHQQQQLFKNQLTAQMMSLMNNKLPLNLNQEAFASKLAAIEPSYSMDDLLSAKTSASLTMFDPALTPEGIKREINIKKEDNDKTVKNTKLNKLPAKREIPDNAKLNKLEIESMVRWLLDSIGRVSAVDLDKARKHYAQNPQFLPIFDAIVDKFINVKKHREDIVRYIIRRAFKYLKTHTIKKQKVFGKKAYAILCKRYFQDHIDELEKSGINIEDEKELIEFILPYRKNSKNRTMNVNFTAEIFSSKEFVKDYKIFLDHFDGILTSDNASKTAKLIHMAEECYKKGSADKIKNCTRLPWIRLWVDKTKAMAFEIVNSGFTIEDTECNKKLKLENDYTEMSPNSNGIVKQEASDESSSSSS